MDQVKFLGRGSLQNSNLEVLQFLCYSFSVRSFWIGCKIPNLSCGKGNLIAKDLISLVVTPILLQMRLLLHAITIV
jgi:hypothetical protein